MICMRINFIMGDTVLMCLIRRKEEQQLRNCHFPIPSWINALYQSDSLNPFARSLVQLLLLLQAKFPKFKFIADFGRNCSRVTN